ncbi:MAG: hypothetical protein H7Z72_25715 [Bacteroidetes bacterium]|nr:hypothetical protein [Fibrella sp.]
MKTILVILLISAVASPALAQTVVPGVPGQSIVGDSAGRAVSPGVKRMGTGFYRRPGDPRGVVRATLDNMPIKTPDRSQAYTLPNRHHTDPNRYSLPLPDSLRLQPRPR